MFTGLVQEVGTLVSRDGSRFGFRWPGKSVFEVGESIAVSGCCLTVVGSSGDVFYADLVEETLTKTDLGRLPLRSAVNLERPMAAGDVFGGHMVLGHVDGTGKVVSPAPRLRIAYPVSFDAFVVDKGSVAIDGVSLTVADHGQGWVEIAIIPHTAEVTTLGVKRPGDEVNLEFDVIAKYVARMIDARLGEPGGS
ncbi:MAG: riboflavin synthase [Actinomycetota bacterium]|nr:riboflavin synthase [Actinomycetota bacterium]MDA8208274.1 riboflavin synthase [Actinomycetota bacterium]